MDDPVALGQFEQLVLTAILSLGDKAYGVTIHARIEELAKPRTIKLGAVYATLDRLEQKGLLSSKLGSGTPVRAGRARRYYRLKPVGLRALNDARAAVDNIWRGHTWPLVKARSFA